MFFNSEMKNNILSILLLCNKMAKSIDEIEIEVQKEKLKESPTNEDISSKLDEVIEMFDKVDDLDKKVTFLLSLNNEAKKQNDVKIGKVKK